MMCRMFSGAVSRLTRAVLTRGPCIRVSRQLPDPVIIAMTTSHNSTFNHLIASLSPSAHQQLLLRISCHMFLTCDMWRTCFDPFSFFTALQRWRYLLSMHCNVLMLFFLSLSLHLIVCPCFSSLQDAVL